MLAADWGVGQVLESIVWFVLFFIWIWLAITVFADIFRSHDIGNGAKALWVLFIIVLPYIGVLAYLFARGHKMSEHAMQDAQAQDAALRAYIRDAAGTRSSPVDDLDRLSSLRDRGVIDDAEFNRLKARVVPSSDSGKALS